MSKRCASGSERCRRATESAIDPAADAWPRASTGSFFVPDRHHPEPLEQGVAHERIWLAAELTALLAGPRSAIPPWPC
jgi:hypothetical protein